MPAIQSPSNSPQGSQREDHRPLVPCQQPRRTIRHQGTAGAAWPGGARCAHPSDESQTERLGVKYGPEIVGLLKAMWLQHEQPCGKRLLAISASQIDRLLAPFRAKTSGRRPYRASEVCQQVPLRTGIWEASGPGWLENRHRSPLRRQQTWQHHVKFLPDRHPQWMNGITHRLEPEPSRYPDPVERERVEPSLGHAGLQIRQRLRSPQPEHPELAWATARPSHRDTITAVSQKRQRPCRAKKPTHMRLCLRWRRITLISVVEH